MEIDNGEDDEIIQMLEMEDKEASLGSGYSNVFCTYM